MRKARDIEKNYPLPDFIDPCDTAPSPGGLSPTLSLEQAWPERLGPLRLIAFRLELCV